MENTKNNIEKMRRAAAHIDDVLTIVPENILKIGATEKDVCNQFDEFLTANGNLERAFPTIIAFGENTAEPHHTPSDRELAPNEHVLIDCGVKIDGWCSDCTRNFFVGDPDPEFLEKFEKLLEIFETTLPLFLPGTPVKVLDKFVREKLGADAKFFVHTLGHGVGREVHEPPKISVKSDEILEENSVVTCEPGIYFPGKFGIRIEDQLVVRKDEPEILTRSPRTLQVFEASGEWF
ncbi:M24 family metallopeptidase [bacterium]|jgi:Xaa-Pro aminopeptidase|nr:M24 family metallopeptidase [bacterium]MBT6832020.1 M24 family metallopeptidase [bacterium]MBT6995801.1 M24 family metallopeptidase [bacterium]MBT7772388.1 M24 family metallopeptidase [bacterium]